MKEIRTSFSSHKFFGGPKPDPYLEQMLKQHEKLEATSTSTWNQFSKIVKEEAQDVLKSYKPTNTNKSNSNTGDKKIE